MYSGSRGVRRLSWEGFISGEFRGLFGVKEGRCVFWGFSYMVSEFGVGYSR